MPKVNKPTAIIFIECYLGFEKTALQTIKTYRGIIQTSTRDLDISDIFFTHLYDIIVVSDLPIFYKKDKRGIREDTGLGRLHRDIHNNGYVKQMTTCLVDYKPPQKTGQKTPREFPFVRRKPDDLEIITIRNYNLSEYPELDKILLWRDDSTDD